MHIPENYLSPSTCAVFDLAALALIGVAAKKVTDTVPKEKMPLLGVAAAFSFVVMMFNIPLVGGTTGHAVGATLIAILFGPWASTLAVSIALILQAFLFGDGGILALGANCFNMAFVAPMVGYSIYSQFTKHISGTKGELAGAAIGSYVGINAAALFAAIEFGIQPLLFTDASGMAMYCPYPLSIAIPAMMVGHLSIAGIAEAIFTVGILSFVAKVSPSMKVSNNQKDKNRPSTLAPLIILLGTLVVLTPLGLIAEGDAWGEWGIEDLSQSIGYLPSGMANGWEWSSLAPDYVFGSIPLWAGYILSAVIGVSLLIIIFKLISLAMKNKVDFG